MINYCHESKEKCFETCLLDGKFAYLKLYERALYSSTRLLTLLYINIVSSVEEVYLIEYSGIVIVVADPDLTG